MRTPLILLAVSAILAAVAVIGLTADRWQDWPKPNWAMRSAPEAPEIDVRKVEGGGPAPEQGVAAVRGDEQPAKPAGPQPAPEIEPRKVEGAGPPPPETQSAAQDQPPTSQPEQQAAVTPEARQEGPAPEASTEGQQAATPPSAAGPRRPSFDVVRVESGGSLVVAGTAEPGAELSLLVDGKVIGGGNANASGEWVILPEEPLAPGSHEVVVEATDQAGSKTASDQVVAIVVPDEPEERPLVVLTEPSRPAKVLEKPGAPEARETPPSAPAEEQEVAVAPQPDDTAPPSGPPETEPERTSRQGEPARQEPRLEEPPAPKLGMPLSLDVVDYNDEGDIVFSGRAEPGSTVRIYVDHRFIGEAVADLTGHWSFAGREQVAPGAHTLRADRIDSTGEVLGRIELPFVRADSSQVAALVEARRREQEREARQPEPQAEAKSDKQAVTPRPEPQPDAAVEKQEPQPEAADDRQEPRPTPQPSPGADQLKTAEPVPQPQQTTEIEEEKAERAPQPKTEARIEDEQAQPVPLPQGRAVERQPEPAPQPAETAEDEPAPPAPAGAPPPDQKLAAAPAEAAEGPAAEATVPGQVVIQPGNNLWRISRVIYGRGVQYTVIYEANRDHIRDPDLIYPGQIFTTPGVKPPREIDPRRRAPLKPEEFEGANSE